MDDHLQIGVIIVTVSKYNDFELHSLPSALANGETIRDTIQSSIVGLPTKNILYINDQSKASILSDIIDFVDDYSLIIFYYAGHGVMMSSDESNGFELFLTTPDSNQKKAFISSISINELKRSLKSTKPSKQIILILDCCFSGMSIGRWNNKELAILASTRKHGKAKYPPNAKYSIFTEALIKILEGGVDVNESHLSIRDVYQELKRVLNEDHEPEIASHGDLADRKIFENSFISNKKEHERRRFHSSIQLDFNSKDPLEELRAKIDESKMPEIIAKTIEEVQYSSGITYPELVFGRHKVLKRLFLALVQGRNRCISGVKWIGKTTILQAIASKAVQNAYSQYLGISFDEYSFLYFDMRNMKTPDEFYYELVMSLFGGDSYSDTSLERIRLEIEKNGQKLILLLDNYDSILKNEYFDEKFINDLKVNSNYDCIKIAYTRTIGRKYTEEENRKKHYFFASVEKIGFLSEGYAKKYVHAPLEFIHGKLVNEDLVDKLIYLGGVHPFFLGHVRNIANQILKEDIPANALLPKIEIMFKDEILRHYKDLLSNLNSFQLKRLRDILIENERDISEENYNQFVEDSIGLDSAIVLSEYFRNYFLKSYYPSRILT